MPKPKKATQPRKMSDIMMEMSDRLLLDPKAVHSAEARHVALFFANLAWNECVGLGDERERTKNIWQTLESENPKLWDELKSRNIDAMIDELVEYKKAHYPDDRRRIFACGGTDHSTFRVEWLSPATPDVDAKWETTLYGMVRSGMMKEATRFVKTTQGTSAAEAKMLVAKIAKDLGMI
jgi:hypothetical protein